MSLSVQIGSAQRELAAQRLAKLIENHNRSFGPQPPPRQLVRRRRRDCDMARYFLKHGTIPDRFYYEEKK